MKISNLSFLVLVLASLAFVSCKEEKKEEADETMEQNDEDIQAAEEAKMKEEARASSIASKAMATDNLSTLVSALEAADLASMLSEPGNYTVFAPTDNAFSKLKKGQLEELLQPENKEDLTVLLKNHVVSGKVMADQLRNAIETSKGKYTFKTVGGGELTASMDGDQIVIKGERGKKSQVLQGNIEASNGIVHIVNDVLMPKM
ncbi:MAG: fasciclin domain-containing protein [Pricia sp.]